MKNAKLYVGNLSWDSDENSVREAFVQYGDVVEVKLITDRETGRPRGFGFVTMATADAAQAAIAGLDGSQLQGRSIRVNIAEDRQRRPGARF
ncbi:MAG: RNA recognition motif domain-containing protein [Myxococcota bacterium]